MIKKQSVEEWIKNGGHISVCKKQKNDTTISASDFIKKDVKLRELRKLKKTINSDENHIHDLINEEIRQRLAHLKH